MLHLAHHVGGSAQRTAIVKAAGINTHPFDALTPETLLDAIASAGFESDGRLLALNSFENRVYQIGLEDGTFVVAKFYRPQRWSDAAIEEEHEFTRELVEAELAVVAPLARDGVTLFHYGGFRFAVFPRRGGRAPELEGPDNAAWMGRTLARLHLVGQRSAFRERGTISVPALVREPMRSVLQSELLPYSLHDRYETAVLAAADVLDGIWREASPRMNLRLHGDCHGGNVLWTDAGPVLVDFDDARSGPAVQDLWMLLTGDAAQRGALLDGYSQFREFDYAELSLIEPLRLMRQIHYAGWLAQRWDDPAFPRAFPWAGESRYWETHVADINDALEQL